MLKSTIQTTHVPMLQNKLYNVHYEHIDVNPNKHHQTNHPTKGGGERKGRTQVWVIRTKPKVGH